MKLDHIEIYVPDRREAAAWYARVFGFEVIAKYERWAIEGGPLMITNDGGDTMLALFEGPEQGASKVVGLRRLAFRVDAQGFRAFLDASGDWHTPALGPGDVSDHDGSLSVYFRDPWGTQLEVTTYDEKAKAALGL